MYIYIWLAAKVVHI